MTEVSFPDQFAVEFIRKSLWRKTGPRASVMVGAGFSRNARKTSPSAREMPTWPQMAQSLCALLYADASKESFQRAVLEANSTSGFLRLAQEYKAAFGQSALNEQIRALVPDLEYEPGALHKSLLMLPWAEVLTTNWDTLLERTADNIYDVNYDVIRTHSEIASSVRPRIVKLHGTLPAHEPFIFTEDDYRTYPRLHAPFVNLVQQTLMESILCLIGFSGDDPNFLHWSGWVRDNLGANAPKIYLVGWLELTPSRKRMLEDRNVVPIDLAALPAASEWPSSERHRNATEWFLKSISIRDRFQPEDWPNAHEEPVEVPTYLGRIAQPREKLPKPEPFAPSSTGGFNTDAAELAKVIETWRWNRDMYPGWAIAPSAVRQRIWMNSFKWIHPIVRMQSSMHPFEFLAVLDELTWRLELALAPNLPELQQPIRDCLNCFNFSEQSISTTDAQPKYEGKIHWPNLKIIWTRVSLGLVRCARVHGAFDDAKQMLSVIESVSPDLLLNEIAFEKFLLLRDSSEYQALYDSLQRWNVSGSDSIWATRKAGLLAGLGAFKEATAIVEVELSTIRKNCRRDIVDYASYSREAWLLWMEDTLKGDNYDIRPENVERRKFLRSIGCDALRDFNEMVDRLAVQLNKKEQSSSGFYRNSGERITFTNGLEDDIRTAVEILQFYDYTGLPRAMRLYSVLGPGLRLASSALQEREPFFSAMASFRGADSCAEEKFSFWSRNNIAALSEFHFSTLFSIVFKEAQFCLSSLAQLHNDRWRKQLEISLEVLARLAIRVSPEQAVILLDFCLKIFGDARYGNDITLGTALRHFTESVFLACTSEILEEKLAEIFSLPLSRDINIPEVSEIFPIKGKVGDKFHQLRDKRLDVIIRDLSDSLLSTDNNVFSRAHARIRILTKLNALNQKEYTDISNCFWNIKCKDFTLWVMGAGHYPWANLMLPCTESRRRDELFKKTFLFTPDDGTKFYKLGYVGITQQILINFGKGMDFNEREILELKSCVSYWCEAEINRPKSELARIFNPESNFDEDTFAKGLAELIPVLKLSRSELQAVFTKTKSIYRETPSSLRILPYIANHLLHENRAVEAMFRGILVSDDANMIRAACHALWHWLNQLNIGALTVLPNSDIMTYVGNIIGNRKISGLVPALELATWIVKNGHESTKLLVLRDSEVAMNLLFDDTRYNGSLVKTGIDVSSIRVAMANFSSAVNQYYRDTPEIFSTILTSFANDELVEVRNAALGLAS